MYLVCSGKPLFSSVIFDPSFWTVWLQTLMILEASMWTLIVSCSHNCSVDWLCCSNSFFLWSHLSVSFAVCFGSLSCGKIRRPDLIVLVDARRFTSIISQHMASFIIPSIIWSLPVPWDEKHLHTMMPPTSKRRCWFSVFQFWATLSQPCPNVQTVNEHQHTFSSVMKSCWVSACRLSTLPIVFSVAVVPAASKCFWSSFWVTTTLTVLLTPWPEIL